jgi:uncharacterized protein (DUF1800 family)
MKISRRQFVQAGAAATAVALAGCDKIPDFLTAAFRQKPAYDGPFRAPASAEIDLISHALNRVTFGARPHDYGRVAKLASDPQDAVAAFLEQQLAPDTIDDSYCARRIRRFETLAFPLGEMFEFQEKLLLSELQRSTLLRACISERQLFEVMVQFWSDHFNIDPSKGDCKWLKTSDDRDVIRRHALGKFPDLLRASALSPAMLWYLDGRVNRKARPDENPNQNYARELLELHTLGVHGGYTNQDVMEVARCLTGWTVRGKKEARFKLGTVEFHPKQHDFGEKKVLGITIPAGGGAEDLDRVLEIVQLHPSTANHIATKLCRRFIDDEPPVSAVETVAGAFLQSGGDIRETLRALFATREFLETRGNKFKRPFHFVVSALRAVDAETTADLNQIEFLVRMGHAPFNYPTPDGYPEEAAPWLGTLLWRWNFAVALTEGRVEGAKFDFEALKQKFGGDEQVMAHFLGRQPTDEEAEAYRESGNGMALLLASPAFQKF